MWCILWTIKDTSSQVFELSKQKSKNKSAWPDPIWIDSLYFFLKESHDWTVPTKKKIDTYFFALWFYRKKKINVAKNLLFADVDIFLYKKKKKKKGETFWKCFFFFFFFFFLFKTHLF
jgi:hypothetical protein